MIKCYFKKSRCNLYAVLWLILCRRQGRVCCPGPHDSALRNEVENVTPELLHLLSRRVGYFVFMMSPSARFVALGACAFASPTKFSTKCCEKAVNTIDFHFEL